MNTAGCERMVGAKTRSLVSHEQERVLHHAGIPCVKPISSRNPSEAELAIGQKRFCSSGTRITSQGDLIDDKGRASHC